MEDNTIHLWGTDGARAGSITLTLNGSANVSIIQVEIAVCGFKNFDFWWHKIHHDIQQILFTQKEIAETEQQPNKDRP